MADVTSIDAARQIMGDDVVGADELQRVFGALEEGGRARAQSVPFAAAELRRAKASGELLILRLSRCDGAAVTLQWLIARFPDAFDHAFLRKMGYQLKEEWGIELEPLAGTEICRPQWALVQPVILDETKNLSYDEQDEHVARYAQQRGVPGKFRRRAAVEIAFDTIATQHARGRRLLASSWDWSGTRTLDGGYLNLGRAATDGLQVFSYSRAVRHGLLGVCPTRDPD